MIDQSLQKDIAMLMYQSNPRGYSSKLTMDMHQRIMEAIPKVLTPRLVAAMVRLHEKTLFKWLSEGAHDVENEIESPFGHLFLDFKEKLAEECEDLIKRVRNGSINWGGAHELLRVVAREDFGREAVELKELFDLYKKIVDDLKALKLNPTQGVLENGQVNEQITQENPL